MCVTAVRKAAAETCVWKQVGHSAIARPWPFTLPLHRQSHPTWTGMFLPHQHAAEQRNTTIVSIRQ